jgi:hypothetical protein
MIDKAIVQNHPNIDRLMGCIDNSFSTYTFWTFLFSVNKQIQWKKLSLQSIFPFYIGKLL